MIDWKNPQLEQLLIEKGQNTQEVWDSILLKSGSVQHLDFLDKDEKAIFRTFTEIPQLDLIQMAGDRQQYIDQAQSLNVNIPTNTPAKDILKLSVRPVYVAEPDWVFSGDREAMCQCLLLLNTSVTDFAS